MAFGEQKSESIKMSGPSFFSIIGLFGGGFGMHAAKESKVEEMEIERKGTKRIRDQVDFTGPISSSSVATPVSVTPTLILDGERSRASKRLRVTIPSSLATPFRAREPQENCELLMRIPEDVVASNILSFLNTTEDRFALQCTCKEFRRISNRDKMMANIKLEGDSVTGDKGILNDKDTPATAMAKLRPFARAKNLEATYMLGMIKTYCNPNDVEKGIFLLKLSSSLGCVRSSYALGLILRDTAPEDSTLYFKDAADQGYLPALQEILSAREMKSKYGEPDASKLRKYLGPVGLNRLLGRHYVQSSHLRDVNTSHCWNPLCGKWAFKATTQRGQTVLINPVRSAAALGPDGHAQHSHGHVHGSTARGVSLHHHHHQQHGGIISSNHRASARGGGGDLDSRVSRMKMCSRCCRAKYCSKLCQVYDWRSGRHKMECQFL